MITASPDDLRPFDQTVLDIQLLGQRLRLRTGRGLFSADRIDDGTRLLLDNLPSGTPQRILDMGCGYGALGLPVAAVHPGAQVLLVDRDLLAVQYARANALQHGLHNVTARPSLGYLAVGEGPFDWVLCNIPARIGKRGVAHLMECGAARLSAGGEYRAVVIRDLMPVVEELARERGWPLRSVAAGERHHVYALSAVAAADEDAGLYKRDEVTFQAGDDTLVLDRPHDASEDPTHVKEGMPLLLECLPRAPRGTALVMRAGYGAPAVLLARRGASVTTADRDLMAIAYTQRNARRHGVEVAPREAVWLPAAVSPDERFDLVVGELNAGTGVEVAVHEVATSRRILKPGGQALWLALGKLHKQWVEPMRVDAQPVATLLASRGPYTVFRVAPPRERKK
ncbi:MAG: methyltransferase [Myxococcota bacterium]